MSAKAKAIYNLYIRGKITKSGVREAAESNPPVITPEEYEIITGEPFPATA